MKLLEGGPGDLFNLALWYPYRWGVSFMRPGRELERSRHLGRLLGWLDPDSTARIAHNLARAFPHRRDLSSLALECLEHRFENQFLSLSFEKLDRSTLPTYLEFEGLEMLDAVLRRGQGCILTYPHLGPVMLPLFGLCLLQYPIAQISAQEEPDGSSAAALAAWRVRRHLEGRVPAAIVDAGSYLRPTLRRLKNNECVLVAYDGTGGGEAVGRRVEVSMLGQTVRFPVGALYLAIRSGAPLLPMALVPASGRPLYRAVISPEMPIEHRGDLRETLRYNAQKLAGILEDHLRRHPGLWHLWPEFEPGQLIVRSSEVA